MSIDSLKDVYIDQLQDLVSANRQSLEVTRALAEAAGDHELKQALERGVEGISDGIEQMSAIIKAHDADPDGEFCKGMEGLVKEARAHAIEETFGDDDTRDAMIITQYQRMAHYAIAGYGCLVAFARRLDQDSDAKTIQEALDQCYEGDRTLTRIATSGVNAAAV